MKKYKWNEWDAYVVDVQVYGYASGRTETLMRLDAARILEDLKNAKITSEQYQTKLDENGFKNWTTDEVKSFVEDNGDEDFYKRLEQENTDKFAKYYNESKNSILDRIKIYRNLQNSIYEYADNSFILKNAEMQKSDYDIEIILARLIRSLEIYEEAEINNLATIIGGYKISITNIVKLLRYVEFDYYGEEFLSEEAKKYDIMESFKTRIVNIAITIAELIWRAEMKNIDVRKYVLDITASTDYESEIIELVKSALNEHIERMDKVLSNGYWPVKIILQMLGYAAYSKSEYDQHIIKFDEILNKQENFL